MNKRTGLLLGTVLGIVLVLGIAHGYRESFFNEQMQKNIKAQMLSESHFNEMTQNRFNKVLECVYLAQKRFVEEQSCPSPLEARIQCLREKGINIQIKADINNCDEIN